MLTSFSIPDMDRNTCRTIYKLFAKTISGDRNIYITHQRKPQAFLYWSSTSLNSTEVLKKQERLSFFSYLSFMLICHLVVFREVPLVPFSFLFGSLFRVLGELWQIFLVICSAWLSVCKYKVCFFLMVINAWEEIPGKNKQSLTSCLLPLN